MKPLVKKSISVIIILSLIAGAIFLGIKWLSPVPSNMQAYNLSVEFNQDDDFMELQTNLQNFLNESLIYVVMANYNMETYQQLKALTTNLKTIKHLSNFYASPLAFAKNTNTYNKKAAEAKNNYGDLKKAVESANTYYTNNVLEYMSSSAIKKITIINDYSLALKGLVSTAFESAAKFTSNLSEIYNNLEPDFQTNALSIKLVQIANKWLDVQMDFISDSEKPATELQQNSNLFYTYVTTRINQTVALAYNDNIIETQSIIDASAKANVRETIENYGIITEESYLATIENEEIKTATQNLLVLIKGE